MVGSHVEILLVEDGKFFRTVIKSQIENQLGFKVTCAETFEQAREIIDLRGGDLFLALLDLKLPDARDGEIVDMAIEKSIPSIVFSSQFSEDLRNHLLQRNIIDYVVKDSPASMEYVISMVKRLHQNQFVKVLIVDDSKTARFQIRTLLLRYKFQVIEATDGIEALNVLDENPDTLLIITDYNMPNLDGFELTKKIRSRFSKRQVAIIGVSSYGNHALSARFIKVGANDFVTKPFLNEEFFLRVSQNVEMLEHIHALQDSLITDYLTGLRNRRYLFERGHIMGEEAKQSGGYLVAAMADIDHFKIINDTYGHDAGDEALKHIARLLDSHFKGQAVVARFGGEEFCILMCEDETVGIDETFESLRTRIENSPYIYGENKIRMTVSFGVCWTKTDNFEDVIKTADGCLYQAKHQGRNQVVIH
ncbi:MAG: diguanylate cyclase [bacterium]